MAEPKLRLFPAGFSSTDDGLPRIELISGNIVEEDTDAIANAANAALAGGGGVDGAIHRAAGPKLLTACQALRGTLPNRRLATGEAVITPGFELAARHVIHCVGPIYDHHPPTESARLLGSCYRRALAICRRESLTSIAFPAISAGVYGYPLDQAAHVALSTLVDELRAYKAPRLVKMVLFGDDAMAAFVDAAEDYSSLSSP